MKLSMLSRVGMASVFALVLAISMSLTQLDAQQSPAGVAIDADDVGGTVTSPKGPEAGVWVIAESTDLPTKMARIVVTDDQGRYVLPDLPRASYQVFVRGYGLVDSQRQAAKPGQQLNLKVDLAPNPRAAAEVYPAAWWLSMAELPEGPQTPRQAADNIRGCLNCHQLGNKATREILPSILTDAKTHLEAWDLRTQMGPAGPAMGANFKRLGAQRSLFANWSERIAKGEAPKQAPPRPTGVERNVVITWWDWGTPTDGRTDASPTDIHRPTVNANGPIYGVSQPTDLLLVVDPLEHRATSIKVPSKAPKTGAVSTTSPYWANEPIWERMSDPRSVALDSTGRVWFTGRTRGGDNPAYCTSNKFGKYHPLETGGRQVFLYEPKTKQFTEVDTCFTADHNQISTDNVMYFGMNNAIGWLDLNAYDKTKNVETSQGWCPAVLDTTGDGRIGEYTKLKEPADPMKDQQVPFNCYSVSVSPKDGSAWCSGIGPTDNKLVRLERGSNPPMTCKAEVFEAPPTGVTPPAYGTGGIHVDKSGVVWQNWRGSGHFSSFDRSKCKVTTGPTATGQSCPEGTRSIGGTARRTRTPRPSSPTRAI